MPHSVSLPFSVLLSEASNTQPSYKTVLPREKLKTAIRKALNNDEAKFQALLEGKLKVVNSCGSGMTAAILWLALQELGVESAIYDEVRIFSHNINSDFLALMAYAISPGRAML